MRRLLLALSLALCLVAQKHPHQELVDAARIKPSSPALRDLLVRNFPGAKDRGVTAVWGQDFLFAIETGETPVISIDGEPPAAMLHLPDSNLWYRLAKLRIGVTHAYQFYAAGKPLGNRSDVTGYNPDSYPQPGVRQGKVSEKKIITSKVYPGMTSDYWVYVSPGADCSRGAAVMIWQDGENLFDRYGSRMRLFTVTENLVHQKLLPPLVHVMIASGNARKMRSIEYDTVSDRYGRFLLEEVLPDVEKSCKLRPDAYSRGIAGESSGGICAFTAAWYFPNQFSRVHSAVGSFTALQWRYGQANPADNLEGGNIYPFLVRREPRKNIRIWMSTGLDDNENRFGSWPLQNIQLANSLKMKEYDFHFRYGEAAHGGAQAALDLPESLTWLWRDYDPAKTEQVFEMEPSERSKPLYRVKIVNRDAW